MRWNLLGLAGLFTLSAPTPQADACGLRVPINTAKPRAHIVAHSSRPSHVLVVGTQMARLMKDLADAGHDVEKSDHPRDAKRGQDYEVVIVDQPALADAKKRFRKSFIIVQSGDITADEQAVESAVGRPVIAHLPPPGAPAGKKLVDSGGSSATGTRVASGTSNDILPTPAAPPPEQHPARAETRSEVYFTVGSTSLSASAKTELAAKAKWITDHSDAQLALEGYADPTGSAEANMLLSQARAEAVRDFLISAGVDRARLEVRAFGSTKLEYGTTDRRNRRVQLLAK